MGRFICVSDEKPSFNYKGEAQGTIPKRGLFFHQQIGRRRVYRRDFDSPPAVFKLKVFVTKQQAQNLCNSINEAHNDDFKVESIEQVKQ